MFRRSLLLALTLVVFVAGPASADEERSATIDLTTLGDGYVDVAGTGCEPNVTVTSEITEVASISGATITPEAPTGAEHAETDAQGSFEIRTFVGPEPGQYVNTVTCGDLVQNLAIQVTEETLPQTSDESSVPLVRLALVLVVIGGVTVWAVRRRQPLIRT